MRILINQRVPAADNVTLATDVYLPDGPGPFPVIFTRTPYDRRSKACPAPRTLDSGYAFVLQDTRGKFDSDGVLCPPDERDDGAATLDWIANQRWCNGRIGMRGLSYLGIVQIPAAASGHEALRCIAPGVAPNSFFRDWIRYDGCFAAANAIRWALVSASQRTRVPDELLDWRTLYAQTSLDRVFEKAGCSSDVLRQWVENDVEDDYWRRLDQRRMYPAVRVPGLHQGGWFDHISRGQFESFNGIAAAPQRLLVGPWEHRSYGTESGDWQFGPEAEFSRAAYEERFLDLWLKDIDDGLTEEPPVKLFLLGENRWREFDAWPPSGVQERPLYLHSDGKANALAGDGRLNEASPNAQTPPDRYTYDPADPTPSWGGPIYRLVYPPNRIGPVDQRPILQRDDVLFYRGERLPRATTVVGEPKLDLWFASDAEDTDAIAKLCVMEPAGRIIVLTVGSLRLRYREGWDRYTALPKDEPVRCTVRLNPIGYRFPQGSRVCLIVTSSSFPRILPNPNTLAPTWKEPHPRVARNQVLHDAAHPSNLLLPVLEE